MVDFDDLYWWSKNLVGGKLISWRPSPYFKAYEGTFDMGDGMYQKMTFTDKELYEMKVNKKASDSKLEEIKNQYHTMNDLKENAEKVSKEKINSLKALTEQIAVMNQQTATKFPSLAEATEQVTKKNTSLPQSLFDLYNPHKQKAKKAKKTDEAVWLECSLPF